MTKWVPEWLEALKRQAEAAEALAVWASVTPPDQWKRAEKLAQEWPITMLQALRLTEQFRSESEQNSVLREASALGRLGP